MRATPDWSTTLAWEASQKNNILYSGYRYGPEAGLYHVRHRYLHPGTAWMSPDPERYADGMNTYLYVKCNPETRTDPSGALAEDLRTVAQWLGWGKEKLKEIEDMQKEAKKEGWIKEAAKNIGDAICPDKCRNTDYGNEADCRTKARAIAESYVNAFFENAYSDKSYAYRRALNDGTPNRKVQNFWNSTGRSSVQDVSAGWWCYHWMLLTWSAVKTHLVFPASSTQTSQPSGFFTGNRAGDIDVKTLPGGNILVSLNTNFVVIRSACDKSARFKDDCSVRLDPWLEGLPKVYAPKEHKYSNGNAIKWNWDLAKVQWGKTALSYDKYSLYKTQVLGWYLDPKTNSPKQFRLGSPGEWEWAGEPPAE